MATITILYQAGHGKFHPIIKGIGTVKSVLHDPGSRKWILSIPRMSETRFENVVKRVLTKNLTEQGITPLSITYSE